VKVILKEKQLKVRKGGLPPLAFLTPLGFIVFLRS
jgi:hypothetical protein